MTTGVGVKFSSEPDVTDQGGEWAGDQRDEEGEGDRLSRSQTRGGADQSSQWSKAGELIVSLFWF